MSKTTARYVFSYFERPKSTSTNNLTVALTGPTTYLTTRSPPTYLLQVQLLGKMD